ncbi:hypothetical protein Bdt_0596 [Bdellovibrio bacteriovorus str. Tiberius]|uniref:DUF2802 domain-containing protein n=1 Tax=Bdellovibrio bacteriovorus str. Tiberius TaxID=1069642 RepID=K7Z7K7_BDEBC|nr:hypothetical protein Bdt_0596 [Bdellovibrio bacteriovorus str. Tiberius]
MNLILLAGVVGLWVRLNRPPKDDPRLSKGLQLLQSKIAVLEDLSDRTETQVNQLTALLEQKVKDIQAKIQAADKQIGKIDQNMQKSMEVAKIFQDRIPHTEIIERQNTVKYVKAARMAHQGSSVDEIAREVDLSRGEIEFIAKVNRDQLMFCEDSLPEWANEEIEESAQSDLSDVDNISFMTPLQREIPIEISTAFEVPKTDQEALKKLGDAFKAACNEVKAEEAAAQQTANNVSALFNVTQNIAQNFLSEKPTPAAPTAAQVEKKRPVLHIGEPEIRPVQFRRIDLAKDLD